MLSWWRWKDQTRKLVYQMSDYFTVTPSPKLVIRKPFPQFFMVVDFSIHLCVKQLNSFSSVNEARRTTRGSMLMHTNFSFVKIYRQRILPDISSSKETRVKKMSPENICGTRVWSTLIVEPWGPHVSFSSLSLTNLAGHHQFYWVQKFLIPPRLWSLLSNLCWILFVVMRRSNEKLKQRRVRIIQYRNNDGFVFIVQGLVTGSRIDDGQSLMRQIAISILVQPTPIWSAML